MTRLPVLLQSEAAECGIASLAMILNFHGHTIDMITMRRKHELSLEGITLKELIDASVAEKLEPRPVRVELESIGELELPCIIHWDLNHFCVLKEVGKNHVVIHDPARGEVKMPISQFSDHFTGIALELLPTTNFEKKTEKATFKITILFGDPKDIAPLLAQVLVLTLLLQVFALTAPIYGQMVIDEVVIAADYNLLFVLAIGFFILLLFEEAVKFLQRWVSIYLSSSISLVMGVSVFRHLLRLPMSYFEKRHIGDVVSRFEGIESIKNFMLNETVDLLISLIMIIFSFVLMMLYSSPLASIVFIGSLCRGFLGYLSYLQLYDKNEALVVAKAREDSNFMETVRSMQTVKLYNKQNERKILWLNNYADTVNQAVLIEKIDMIYDSLRDIATGIEHILVYALAAHFIIQDQLSVGMVFAFIAYKSTFSGSFEKSIDGIIAFKMIGIERDRLADIILTEREPFFEGSALPQKIQGKIILEKVTYSYSSTTNPVFEDISCTIQAGESVVITGPSGSGKSTLLKIMLGLFQPSSGRIYVDDISLQDMGLKNYRTGVATVMQEESLFSGSILENITLFAPNFDMDEVIEACEAACVHEVIEGFSMGYQTLVGDMGNTLSGGQKQRLLLARALYSKPAILAMDEATSALDVELEKKVNAHLRQLNITRISIAHRPETIKMANRCFYLNGGKMRELKQKKH